MTRPNKPARILAWIVVAVLGLTLASVAFAATRGSSAQGRPFVSGGISVEELQALHTRRDDFSFWVVTAAKRAVTTIHAGDHHQAFLYFDAPDEVSPEGQNPFERNPYGK